MLHCLRTLVATSLCLMPLAAFALPVDRLRLPSNLKVEQVADVDNARQMALAPDGTLFVGSRQAGRVYRLRDLDGDGQYEQQKIVLKQLAMPSGITFHQGALYIAALNRILRLDNPLADKPGPLVTLTDQLPNDSHHGWKYLKVGPDRQLYFNIGAPCNICLSRDKRFAAVLRMPLKGGPAEIVAHGVRNSVGFDWHPQDKALWFTDNGRDWLGDDQPDDELNRLDKFGRHFGYPYLHAENVRDPEYGHRPAPASHKPKALLGAHVAPLGMTFNQQAPWAEPGETSVFIAEHGSWNRSSKVGYRVVRVRLKGNEVIAVEPFIEGWLRNENYWGRPADVIFDRDNSLLISDDYGDAIYRVSPLR